MFRIPGIPIKYILLIQDNHVLSFIIDIDEIAINEVEVKVPTYLSITEEEEEL